MTRWALLLFMTLGLRGIYYPTTLTVTKVEHGVVTMQACSGETYTIEEAEAWRVGDRAECLMSCAGTADKTDDRILEARYCWRR